LWFLGTISGQKRKSQKDRVFKKCSGIVECHRSFRFQHTNLKGFKDSPTSCILTTGASRGFADAFRFLAGLVTVLLRVKERVLSASHASLPAL